MTTSLRKKLVLVGSVTLVFALIDWLTLEIGVLKPVVLGAGSLRVESDTRGAEVLLDGMLRGETPLTIETLLAGDYVLQVRHRFHPPYVAGIRIERGEALLRNVELLAAYGSLTLATNPEGATVHLDGKRLNDLTPTRIDVIEAGQHELVFELFSRKVVTQSIEVLPGQQVEFVAELNRLDYAELTVHPTPGQANVRFVDAAVAYKPGRRVPVGDYRIEVSLQGYRTRSQIHTLRKGVNEIGITLERIQGHLSVSATPADATVSVRVGNNAVAQPYQADMLLPAGRVEVRVYKPGYRSVIKRLQLPESGASLKVRLERFDVVAGQVLQDRLPGGGSAPRVIVVAAGKASIGEVGGNEITALTAQQVTLRQPFAIGITEVTLGEFRRYAESMGVDLPRAKGMDSDAHPVANVSWREAVGYTQWLTRETGNLYRLPTEHEWAYVAVKGALAEEGGAGVCERGNVADQTLHKVFRLWQSVDCDDGWVRSAPVGSYRANGFGVHDLLGNVSEWVSDCGYSGCSGHVARGSAWDSAEDELRLTFRQSYSRPGDTRGFRVVRAL